MGKVATCERNRKIIHQMNLMSDVFASKVFEEPEVLKELVFALTGENIIVKDVRTQYSIRHLVQRSVILDVYAETERGQLIHVEIQNKNDDNHVKRTRYCRCCIDTTMLDKGTNFEDLPDLLQIFITHSDFLKMGSSIFWNTKVVSDGTKELYFNLVPHEGESKKIQELQKYFLDTVEKNESNYFPKLVQRVRFFKMEEKGVGEMCELIDKIHEEGKKEGREEGRKEGIKEGIKNECRKSIIKILKRMGELPDELEQVIQEEEDEEILSLCFDLALTSDSIGEFAFDFEMKKKEWTNENER